MNLKDVRVLFRTRSGRYDLVNSDDSDNGADFFIQSAVRKLDRMITHVKSEATAFGALSSGDFYHVFQRCRSIKEVWVSDATSRTQLKLLTPIEFYTEFAAPKSTIDVGRPAYYTPLNLRATDVTAFESIAQFLQYVRPDDELYNGVVFNPANGSYVIEIKGLFDSKALECDLDTNFWTENFPDLLIIAAMYKLEVFHRNRQGAKDWQDSIVEELAAIEMDMIEQDDQLEDER